MSTRRQRPGPDQPVASTNARVQPADGQSQHFAGRGIGEAPHSRRFRLGVAGVVIFVIVVVITIITDAIISREDSLFASGPAPTIAVSPDASP